MKERERGGNMRAEEKDGGEEEGAEQRLINSVHCDLELHFRHF